MEPEKKTPMDSLKGIGISIYGFLLVAAIVWGSVVFIRNMIRLLLK